MPWEPHKFRGIEYTFNHLLPFKMTVGQLRVYVKSGAHVFCKESEPTDPDDLKFMDGKTVRTFCPVRYGLSSTLPQTMIVASSGYVYEGHSGKFLFKQPLPHPQGVYVIAFEMWKNKSPHYDVTLQLNSAHIRSYLAKKRFAKFADVVDAVSKGLPVRWTKK
jgi:hypothetical protein